MTFTKIKDDGLTADITSIREDGGTQEIELTVTLAAAALADSPVKFTIVDDAADDPEATSTTEARCAMLITLREWVMISQFRPANLEDGDALPHPHRQRGQEYCEDYQGESRSRKLAAAT